MKSTPPEESRRELQAKLDNMEAAYAELHRQAEDEYARGRREALEEAVQSLKDHRLEIGLPAIRALIDAPTTEPQDVAGQAGVDRE